MLNSRKHAVESGNRFIEKPAGQRLPAQAFGVIMKHIQILQRFHQVQAVSFYRLRHIETVALLEKR